MMTRARVENSEFEMNASHNLNFLRYYKIKGYDYLFF